MEAVGACFSPLPFKLLIPLHFYSPFRLCDLWFDLANRFYCTSNVRTRKWWQSKSDMSDQQEVELTHMVSGIDFCSHCRDHLLHSSPPGRHCNVCIPEGQVCCTRFLRAYPQVPWVDGYRTCLGSGKGMFFLPLFRLTIRCLSNHRSSSLPTTTDSQANHSVRRLSSLLPFGSYL